MKELKLNKYRKLFLFPLFISIIISSCSKEWLDAKPDKALVVPSSLEDLQALLDNPKMYQNLPSLGEIGSGDFYITTDAWKPLSSTQRNSYIWASDVYQGDQVGDWNNPYQQIFYANYTLEQLENIPKSSSTLAAWNSIKGSGLFYRAFAFYNIGQVFAPPYVESGDNSYGIPIRLTSNINVKSSRSSIFQTYSQIISDLKDAASLLPNKQTFKTRPSKPAAYGMLARTYLTMEKYDSALLYSNLCLQLHDSLLDYDNKNDIPNTSSNNPIPRFNKEVIFHSLLSNFSIFAASRLIIDSTLFNSYHPDDMRRVVFFRNVSIPLNTFTFKGSYNNTAPFFTGLASDEIFLIRAECNARKGNTIAAMDDLNFLLQKRWKKTAIYPTKIAIDAEDALKIILEERRKELCFRGLRWSDLRRLNKDSRFALTLTRVINDQIYSLTPNDNKYTLPIPDNEIQISDIQQNPR